MSDEEYTPSWEGLGWTETDSSNPQFVDGYPPTKDDSDSVSDLLKQAQETHERKNEDYNDCWRQVGHTMWRMAGQESFTIEGPEDLNSLGLYWERLIKLYRGFNGEFVADELNYESLQDAHTDNINYAAMHGSLRDE